MTKKVTSLVITIILMFTIASSTYASSIDTYTYDGDEKVTWERTDPITFLEVFGGKNYVFQIDYIPYEQAELIEALKDDYSTWYLLKTISINSGISAAVIVATSSLGLGGISSFALGVVLATSFTFISVYDDMSFENAFEQCVPGDWVKVTRRYTNDLLVNVYSCFSTQFDVPALRYKFYGDTLHHGEFSTGN